MILATVAVSAPETVTAQDFLKTGNPNDFYANQRAPLTPSPLQKLPTGSVKAAGWLKTQLDLQRDGFAGRLPEISKFLDLKNNAWMGTGTQDRAGWEELPYWLKGQVSLAYVTGDKKLIAQIQPCIDAVLKSQEPSGWFGPDTNRDTKLGTPDLWPNMLMQMVLQTYQEATGDPRVVPFMLRYCDYLLSLEPKELIDPRHYWHHQRVGDQLASLVWLYNRTGEKKILDLAARLHKAGARWDLGVANHHGVNFAQAFREPATFGLFSGKYSDWQATEKDLKAFRDEFGQSPGGMYGADENARKGKTDPRQAAETCAVVEMMFSHELLFQYSGGDPQWADHAEDVTFNWLPATMTPDLKALRYLTSPNLAVSDAPSKSPGVENGGPMFLMDPNDHRCCQHNTGMGWPYFTEHLWFATDGNGLLAGIYAPNKVTAKVGPGVKVTIAEDTNYPFEETIRFKVDPAKPVRFPLSLRVPGWCKSASVKLNGKKQRVKPKASQFVQIDRTWKKGDVVELSLPMQVRTETWSQRPGTLSVYRGPLAYSLKIAEETKRVPRRNGWDAFEILPKSAWNYGLAPKPTFTFASKPAPKSGQIWEAARVPVSLTTQARRIPEWGLDHFGLVGVLQKSPARSLEKPETITLIPMGAARLRITVFPTATPTGNKWVGQQKPRPPLPTTYSHVFRGDSAGALSDGLEPRNSHDEEIPRFTWWDHKGTEEWVAYQFEAPRAFLSSRVYWFDDAAIKGECRVPESWKIQAKVNGEWVDVHAPAGFPVKKDAWSEVRFDTVVTAELRLVVMLKPGFSGGILEWELR